MEIVDVLGWIFAAILVVVALVAMAIGLYSMPDAWRYMKIRRM